VYERRHAGFFQDLGECDGVILMRMHAAGRDEADEMAGAAAVLELLDQLGERRCLLDLAARDGAADPRQILHDHAAGPDVEMADLGIAHLPGRQADRLARGVQEAVRTALPQPVEGRRPGLQDGIVGGVLAPAEAVQNDQHDGPPLLHFAFPLEATPVLRIAARASILMQWKGSSAAAPPAAGRDDGHFLT
jgi:hypothetical protein